MLEEKFSKLNISEKNKNSGGANTNKNGLSYEKITDLADKYKIIKKNNNHSIIKFIDYNTIYIHTKQSQLFRYMKDNMNHNIDKGHGCKNPDECFIDEKKKIIFIIEKKFQQVNGSVCEKIQTVEFKLWQYNRTFPEYKVVYIYCLSKWFKTNCKAELTYLKLKKIPVFYGCDINYKKKIINFINQISKTKLLK